MHLSKPITPQDEEDEKEMSMVPYASAVGCLMYVILCTKLDIVYVVSVMSQFQANLGKENWITVKCIMK